MSAARRLIDLSAQASERLYRLGAPAGLAVLAALTIVLFQSIFWAEHVPWPLKLGIAAVAAASVASPPNGLLIAAGLSPLGYMLTTRVAGAYPARITEAIVLAFFAGYAVRAVLKRFGRRRADARPPEPAPRLLAPVVLFGAAAAASCVVHYHFMQVWQDRPWPFFERLVDFLVRGYHDDLGNYEPTAGDAGFRYVFTTAFVIEGAGLVLAAFVFCARDRAFLPRLLRMTVAGAVGAAALSAYALTGAALRETDPFGALPSLLDQRWTMFTPKLNTAASLFVLAGPLAIGAAAADRGWRRSVWTAAAAVLVAALWINGTRVALLAAIVVLAGTIAWFAQRRARRRMPGVPVVAGVVILGLGLAGTAFHRLYVDRDQTVSALNYRVLFTETALRMFASAPAFGVGIDQYYLQSEQFASEELFVASRDYYRRVPAHNPFLQTAAELGVAGLVPFTWMVGAALWACAAAVRTRARDPILFGTLAGLTAFLITTASSGHPLLIEVTAYPFWIVLGLAAARAAHTAPAPPGGAACASAAPGAAPWNRRCIALGVLLLAVSVPPRIAWQARAIDFTEITYGLHGLEDNGRYRYRWTTGRANLFADGTARAVELSLRAPFVERTGPMTVELFLDGRLANRIRITGTDWRRVRMQLPPSGRRHRDLELRVHPTWFPHRVLPGSEDTRELGVMLAADADSRAVLRADTPRRDVS